MRLVFWSEYYAPHIGGVEIIVAGLAEEFARQGHTVAVITNHQPATTAVVENVNGVAVHRFDLTRAIEARDLGRLHQAHAAILALRRSLRPEVEHVHSTGPLLLAFLLAQRALPVPSIFSLHCTHDALANLLATNGTATALLRQARKILSPSHLLRNALLDKMPSLAGSVLVVPYGLPGMSVPPDPLPFAPPVALCLGRVVPEKGFDLALHALARVLPEFPGLRLVIAGDGTARATLQELAATLGIADSIDFPGWISPAGVPALINQATLLLLPSRWQEPFALVALESAQLGRPVITSAVGGMGESVQDGVTGLVVENENVNALAGALRRLLADPAQTRRMGDLARARAEKLFGLPRYFDLHRTLYLEVSAPEPTVTQS
jgi:glycogen(starch) synthase